MKEDILEQLVDDFLQSQGYFTRHNIKFRPSPNHPDYEVKKDSNHSDIDVIGIDPRRSGPDRVVVVSCKSWQSGFRISSKLEELKKNKIVSGREAWQAFRELIRPKWSSAFIEAVESATGTRSFTYILAVTYVIGKKSLWESDPQFIQALGGNPIRIIDLSEMLDFFEKMGTTTVASSDIGRVLQLMRAAQKGKKALVDAVQSEDDE